MSIETRISRLVKKTGVKKSRWAVSLKGLSFETKRGRNQAQTMGIAAFPPGPVFQS
jgi:hypothetical protein